MKVASFIFVFVCVSLKAAPLSIMPLPRQVALGEGRLTIDGGFSVAVCGHADPFLIAAANRLMRRVSDETGIPLLTPVAKTCGPATLSIAAADANGAMRLGADESYRLTVTPATAKLESKTALGVLRGMATFEQLVDSGPSGFSVPAVAIDDAPRFPWRGLMLDACRHWMPVDVVERNLEAMASVKLNIFHWHLSDDQGFRIESKIFPKLQQLGSDGNYYTQEQIREVVSFAAARGIRVVPELEMPGHASALLTAYPELASAPGVYNIERQWGIFHPLLDPSRDATYEFLDKLIGEVAGLFPDEYLHIGGDEVLDTDWKQNQAIQNFMRAHNLSSSAELHAYFNKRVQPILAKYGKKMIGWDEVLQPDLPASVTIQSWRGAASLALAAQEGHQGILSFGYYLDHLKPASYHYANDPITGEAATLSPHQAAMILGGEACMWSEYVSPETVDSRVWPRLGAIAERLWSPATVNDTADMYVRLERLNRMLDWTGVDHRRSQDPMLRRIAGDAPIDSLRVLASSVEALGIDGRHGPEKTSLVPLNRFVDAAFPESEWVRRLNDDAHGFVAGGSESRESELRLRRAFELWRDNPAGIQPFAGASFLLEEVAPLSDTLSKLGVVGLRACDLLNEKRPAAPEWLSEQQKLIGATLQPRSEVVIAAARTVQILIDGLSSERPGLPQASK